MDDQIHTIVDQAMKGVSRRNFIKGVIATGAAVSSAAYVFRGGALLGQQPSTPGVAMIAS